jgi:hypothetical protein
MTSEDMCLLPVGELRIGSLVVLQFRETVRDLLRFTGCI